MARAVSLDLGGTDRETNVQAMREAELAHWRPFEVVTGWNR